jgi:hypothetical protein
MPLVAAIQDSGKTSNKNFVSHRETGFCKEIIMDIRKKTHDMSSTIKRFKNHPGGVNERTSSLKKCKIKRFYIKLSQVLNGFDVSFAKC